MSIREVLGRLSLAIVLALGILAISPTKAKAMTFNVAAGIDTINAGDSICSLSEAIENISTYSGMHPDCPTPNGVDTILLPADTITLSGDLPISTRPYSVLGQGKGVSFIDGANNNNIFRIQLGNSPDANNPIYFEDFTAGNISRGGNGTCISVSHSNSAVQIQSLYINRVNLNDCGTNSLAISMRGSSLSINELSIDSDKTINTAAILLSRIGNAEIKNSTFASNSIGVHTFQGPISPADSSSINSEIKIENSTFYDNHLAISMNSSNNSNLEANVALNVELLNNTVIGNIGGSGKGFWPGVGTGGILLGTGGEVVLNVNMQNNIVANNYFNSTLRNCYTGIAPFSNNVIVATSNNLSDDTCAGRLGGNDFASVAGVADTLDVLADNGGPVRTMALLSGSPAIDQGATIGSITTDARGVSRPQGASYDIGAYEKTAELIDDPDPDPEDPENPGPPGGITAGGTVITPSTTTPTVPRAGKLIGAMIATMSLLALVVLAAKEIVDGRGTQSLSER
jgi:hypothetical protein